MRYEILGSFCVVVGDEQALLESRKLEILLAVLLIRADHVVNCRSLMTELWDAEPPTRAAAGIHVNISRLRKFLKQRKWAGGQIITRSPGYMLQLGSDEVDARTFDKMVNSGREQLRRQEYAAASTVLRSALGLWHGSSPFGGLQGGPILAGYSRRMEESRLECLEMMIEAELALGRHRELVSELYALTTEHPLQETFYRQLMLALYRSDRQADALSTFHSARHVINANLGLEPCQALRDLHHAILVEDRRLDPLSDPAGLAAATR
ncbi:MULTISPECIES: AfsR/SARP family transcriptional regulator [Streptomyces]|jgi:SARP family transcriptional regulator, regulator of embCAB operon|uniref:AfsR/SARP family transcriptional regulator n=1 Tax=Streptomyces doudnae TaxID=3075536 RepID=A0ABD5EX83_9ACTN|nr:MULTISPECIES: AfsR/SARP family transcriptional regulator [unclassified Streptomyces]MDT0439255.1 AfsR/SARP family transcriptional regulator [Streptomyces sp. DSM 41981]MYQ65841.1 activator protein [Streptomyces sp. SID4950]SCE08823.1 DNA-binding transcriptional activator of the SARP family [Streptomyces sp. SolWspMP-5a-2]